MFYGLRQGGTLFESVPPFLLRLGMRYRVCSLAALLAVDRTSG
jgi:hypothetical protein